jgi:hypothetical protein
MNIEEIKKKTKATNSLYNDPDPSSNKMIVAFRRCFGQFVCDFIREAIIKGVSLGEETKFNFCIVYAPTEDDDVIDFVKRGIEYMIENSPRFNNFTIYILLDCSAKGKQVYEQIVEPHIYFFKQSSIEFTEEELVYFLSMFDSYIMSEELAIKGWTINANMDKSLCIVDKTFSFDDDQDLEKYNWVLI